MRIIGFGDLYADYYFKDDILIGICGGKSNANIIANLSKYYNTAFYGCVGNDTAGNVAISSLEKLGVDVSNIKILDGHSKMFFIQDGEYSSECPYCNRRLSYHGLKCQREYVFPYIEDDDVIVLDNMNSVAMDIIHSISNKAFIDIGYLGNLLYSSLDEIIELLGNRFEIINMNERVYKALKKKFAIDSLNLYELLKPKILIITRGKRGADIIFDDILIKKEIDNPEIEVDTSGAGDAFFSEFIHIYLENQVVDEKMISKAYMKANALARTVISHLGARAHLEKLSKIDSYSYCICEDFSISEEK